MSEFERIVPDQESHYEVEMERQERVARIKDLVREMNESGESLPFPGIDPETHAKMQKTDVEYPGITTPIDEIIIRCEREGIKIVLGKDPDSANVYVLPAGSSDVKMDSFAPHQLQVGAVKNVHLLELIRLTKPKN